MKLNNIIATLLNYSRYYYIIVYTILCVSCVFDRPRLSFAVVLTWFSVMQIPVCYILINITILYIIRVLHIVYTFSTREYNAEARGGCDRWAGGVGTPDRYYI